jgi:hypothetical protein
MKTLHILVGLAGCCLWSGCAHDQAEAPSKTAKQDSSATVGQTATSSVVASTNAAPLSYQWIFNSTNTSGATKQLRNDIFITN